MEGARYESIKPLLEAQPYIKSVQWVNGISGATFDFSGFRGAYREHESLAAQQARHIGAKISLKQWLKVDPINHGRVVIARSHRYHNGLFPWQQIVQAYPDAMFAGLHSEYESFTADFGWIEYSPTVNLLELARVIAGAKETFVNQTCAFWIAIGLGVPVVQETMRADQNSIVERKNARYTRTVGEINALIDSLP